MDKMMIGPRISGKSNDEIAGIAYAAVEGLDFLEMNDGNRLGYHIYSYLMGGLPSLSEAIYEAKARTTLDSQVLEQRIADRLRAAGVSVA